MRKEKPLKLDPGIPGKDFPEIDQSKCNQCGICINICPGMLFEMRDNRVVLTRPDWCVQCGHCGATCPQDAIKQPFCEPMPANAKDITTPEFSQLLALLYRARRSVRRYKNQPLTKEDLDKILEAGRYTATGTNAQNIRYVVITDPHKIEELRQITLPVAIKMFNFIDRFASLPFSSRLMSKELKDRLKNRYSSALKLFRERMEQGEDRLFYSAPAILLVFGDKYDDTQAFSCSAALYNCSLMAHTLGIGCCFNGFLQTAINFSPKLKKWFHLPRTQKCYGAMTLGYQNVKFYRLVRRKPVKVEWL